MLGSNEYKFMRETLRSKFGATFEIPAAPGATKAGDHGHAPAPAHGHGDHGHGHAHEHGASCCGGGHAEKDKADDHGHGHGHAHAKADDHGHAHAHEEEEDDDDDDAADDEGRIPRESEPVEAIPAGGDDFETAGAAKERAAECKAAGDLAGALKAFNEAMAAQTASPLTLAARAEVLLCAPRADARSVGDPSSVTRSCKARQPFRATSSLPPRARRFSVGLRVVGTQRGNRDATHDAIAAAIRCCSSCGGRARPSPTATRRSRRTRTASRHSRRAARRAARSASGRARCRTSRRRRRVVCCFPRACRGGDTKVSVGSQ